MVFCEMKTCLFSNRIGFHIEIGFLCCSHISEVCFFIEVYTLP